jgi:hypothetical protein
MGHVDRGEDGNEHHRADDGEGAALTPGDRAKDDGFEHQADFSKFGPKVSGGMRRAG